jgi:hypothetical protein
MVFVQIVVTSVSLWTAQNAPVAPPCREWHECQRLALEAYAQGDYERFHDLAWRTVQTGPARDPDLMYLLARAQSVSGRPHDALVMLGRLAEVGFVTAAATDNDFRAVRQLRQWPEFEATMTAAARPANLSPSAVTRSPDVSPPAVAVARRVEEALRIRGPVLGSAGLAYDRVSSRFVVADASQRKLVIIDERSRHVVDLVTAASAGFYDITALEIDPSRGELWVVSAEPAATAGGSPASALHKLQLVSGRPLERIPVPAEYQPCRFADVAVTRDDGHVVVLDTIGSRLFAFRPATHRLTLVATVNWQSPTSVAPAGDRIVYVAHASGIARVDTVTGATEPVASSPDAPLVGFERIRWARDSLVGIQRLPDGSYRAVRVKIVDRRAAAIDIIDSGISTTDHPVATVSGDEFYVLVHQPASDDGYVVIRRSRLR